MKTIILADIQAVLAAYIDPYLQTDLFTAKVVNKLSLNVNQINLELRLGFPLKYSLDEWLAPLKAGLAASFPDTKINIEVNWQIETHVGQSTLKALPAIKNIIAVASGKGGVGKSTVAVNLALALAQEGAQVGLLDADIYGPSQPTMLGIHERPEIQDKKLIIPIEKFGVQMMSIGLLVDPQTAMVWRGPMISMAMQQLLNDTQWQKVDYLIVDLPPGTGDIQLSLAQKVPLTAALIVTTPQDLALADARRASAMFQKLNVPVLGVVENMAMHHCSHCGHEEAIFGRGGADRLAQEYAVEVLARLPLDARIREQTDSGKPPVVAEPEGPYAKSYRHLALRVAAVLSKQAKDYSRQFPNIKVEAL